MKAREDSLAWSELRPLIAQFEKAIRTDPGKLRDLVMQIVKEYRPGVESVDRANLVGSS